MAGLPTSYVPCTFRELLDGTFRLYRKHLFQIWLFSFLIVTPLSVWYYDGYVDYMYVDPPDAADAVILDLILEKLIWDCVLFPVMMAAFALLPDSDEWSFKAGFSVLRRHMKPLFFVILLFVVIHGLSALLMTLAVSAPLESFENHEGFIGVSAEAVAEGLMWSTFPAMLIVIRLAWILPMVVKNRTRLGTAVRESWKLCRGMVLKTVGSLVLIAIGSQLLIYGWFFMEEIRLSVGITDPEWLWKGLHYLYVAVVVPFLVPVSNLFLILLYRDREGRLRGTDLLEQFRSS
ncbi:hypothetical protein [Staphylospora marina]|uniref:hypothetical protein n=1 Tax=Staphylospora marina TaxID=2490858 RepID=UPI000F5B9289|nr:hypothetical protein [Staphylospora marina]